MDTPKVGIRVVAVSTDEIVDLDGVSCRVWEATERPGVDLTLYVHRVRSEASGWPVCDANLVRQPDPTVRNK